MDRKGTEPGHRKDVGEMTKEELEVFIKELPPDKKGLYVQLLRRLQSPSINGRKVR